MMDGGRPGTFFRWPTLGALMLALTTGVWAEDGDDWKIKWDNGFKLESPDGRTQLKFGGRLQADWTFVDPDEELETELGEINDGNEFRRARLFFAGTVYEKVEFKVQYDFAGGDADFKDAYIGIEETPIGGIRFGHFKEPFSLEELTSSKYITFLERSLPSVFAPSRNTGVMFHDRVGRRLTWAVGGFREADDFGDTDTGEGKLNITARVTGLPWYGDDGRQLLHLGLSVSEKDLGFDPFRFRQRPEDHQTPRFVDTGSFDADRVDLYAAEVAVVAGRFWAAAEHYIADVDSAIAIDDGMGNVVTHCAAACVAGTPLGDPSFDGTYVQVGVFLTHDHRRYKTSAGAFDRLKPGRNFGNGAPGAWEVAVRYSTLDLTDEGIEGGELDDLSLAVNWYLNPVTRLMLNWINAERDDLVDAVTSQTISAEANYFLVRLQVDF